MPLPSPRFLGICVLAVIVGGGSRGMTTGQPGVSLDQALGKWNSTERFEGEPRISVAFRRSSTRSVEGWAVLHGQHHRGDDRAIGWDLRVLTPSTAVLSALTENGQPIQDELKWEMTR